MVDFAAPPARPDAGQSTDFTYAVRPRSGTTPAALYQVPVQTGAGSIPIGTTPGTVAAGDDARIIGAQNAAQVAAAILTVVGAAPAALNTLARIDTALQNDESAAAVLTTLVGQHTATLATKGQASGLAPLDATGKVPAANLPTQAGGSGLAAADVIALLVALPTVQPTSTGQLWWNGSFLAKT